MRIFWVHLTHTNGLPTFPVRFTYPITVSISDIPVFTTVRSRSSVWTRWHPHATVGALPAFRVGARRFHPAITALRIPKASFRSGLPRSFGPEFVIGLLRRLRKIRTGQSLDCNRGHNDTPDDGGGPDPRWSRPGQDNRRKEGQNGRATWINLMRQACADLLGSSSLPVVLKRGECC